MVAGSTLTVRARFTDVVEKKVIEDGSGSAAFYRPGANPREDPGVRASPDLVVPLSYDSKLRRYFGRTPTAGWVTGTWTILLEIRRDYQPPSDADAEVTTIAREWLYQPIEA
jgi:hypothetical protein